MTASVPFSLHPSANSAKIPFDFTFIIGQNRFECHKANACKFCQAVRNLTLCDPTCNQMRIRTHGLQNNFSYFIDFLSTGNFDTGNINNFENYKLLAIELQCETLLQQFSHLSVATMNSPLLVLDFLFEQYKYYQNDLSLFIQSFRKELTFVSKYFSKLINKSPKAGSLPVEILDCILIDDDLDRHITDSQLIQFIMKIYNSNHDYKYLSLFSHVSLEKITAGQAKQIFDIIKGNEISGALWSAIARRLRCQVIE